MKTRENEKYRKYQQKATDNNLIFKPFVVESSGRIGDCGRDFIKQICSYGSKEKKIRQDILLLWCFKRLSISLQKILMQGMKIKIGKLNGRHTTQRNDSAFLFENVLNHATIHLAPLVV